MADCLPPGPFAVSDFSQHLIHAGQQAGEGAEAYLRSGSKVQLNLLSNSHRRNVALGIR